MVCKQLSAIVPETAVFLKIPAAKRKLDEALVQADWDGFEARKAESQARGLLRGRGIGDYLEVTGPPANEMGGIRLSPTAM
jgi:hypothetical protein